MLAKADLTFFLQLRKNFREIGSIFPSSRALAEQLALPISERNSPINILEVGPGSGPMTRAILAKMRSEDKLTVCEINSELLRKLQESLKFNPDFRRHQERVSFFDGPAQNLVQDGAMQKFDVIVCSLPFMNFSPELVDELMGLFHDILAPGGTFTNFEYAVFPQLNKLIGPRSHKERSKAIEDVLTKWRNQAKEVDCLSTNFVFFNFPPAKTYRLSFSPAEESILDPRAALATN